MRWALPLLLVALAIRPAHAQCPDGTLPPCAGQLVARAPSPASVAVLLFDNLSRDTNDLYLADGLTEEITTRLGQIERLQVKSRTAVRRFRGNMASDPSAIGRALGVTYLVNGSVRRAGPALRVAVELTRAATGVRMWGEVFDRADTNLLAVEDDIARAVAVTIAGRLLPQERAPLGARPTRNREAYDRFLRGNYYLVQRTPGAVRRAIEEFEAATRLDPLFAAARARTAFGYQIFGNWGWDFPGLPRDSVSARGQAAADGALRADSTSSDAWMVRGLLLYNQGVRFLDRVVAAFRRATAFSPRNAEVHHQLGNVLASYGDDHGARASYQHALAIDPERPVTLTALSFVSLHQRAYAEARRWLDSALAIDPDFTHAYAIRGGVLLALGDIASARLDARAATRGPQAEQFGAAVLALVEASAGDTATAAPLVRGLAATPRRNIEVDTRLAAAQLRLGSREAAFETLESHWREDPLLRYFLQFAVLDELRDDPRFQRLLAESHPRDAREP